VKKVEEKDGYKIKKCDCCKSGMCKNNEPFCKCCVKKVYDDEIDNEELADYVYNQHYATY